MPDTPSEQGRIVEQLEEVLDLKLTREYSRDEYPFVENPDQKLRCFVLWVMSGTQASFSEMDEVLDWVKNGTVETPPQVVPMRKKPHMKVIEGTKEFSRGASDKTRPQHLPSAPQPAGGDADKNLPRKPVQPPPGDDKVP